jgi:hypothetical protein
MRSNSTSRRRDVASVTRYTAARRRLVSAVTSARSSLPRSVIMVFTKRLREGIRRGRIRCSVRIWMRPHVKAGGRYRMDDGHVVVDSITPIRLTDISNDLAQESGFGSVKDLLETAKHGRGDNVYLVRFHYLPPGAWDIRRLPAEDRSGKRTTSGSQSSSRSRSQLLRRIRSSEPKTSPTRTKGSLTTRSSRRRG